MTADKCPVCLHDAQSSRYADKVVRNVDCPACGNFDSPHTTEVTLLAGLKPDQRAILRHWLRQAPREKEPLVLADDLVRTVLQNHRLPLPDEREDNLVMAVGRAFEATGQSYLVLDLTVCAAEIGALHEGAAYEAVLALVKQALLELYGNFSHAQVRLTSSGSRRYKEVLNARQSNASKASTPSPPPTIIVNAETFSGVVAGSVSGPVSIETQRAATRPSANLRNPETQDRWVDLEYPEKAGINAKLKAQGYRLAWRSARQEATSIDIEGWEYVITRLADGSLARLKIHDSPAIGGYLVLLKQKLN